MLAYRLEINGLGPYGDEGYNDETLPLLWNMCDAHTGSYTHPNWAKDGLSVYGYNRFACPSIETFVSWFDEFLGQFALLKGATVRIIETNNSHQIGYSGRQLTYNINVATTVEVVTVAEFLKRIANVG